MTVHIDNQPYRKYVLLKSSKDEFNKVKKSLKDSGIKIIKAEDSVKEASNGIMYDYCIRVSQRVSDVEIKNALKGHGRELEKHTEKNNTSLTDRRILDWFFSAFEISVPTKECVTIGAGPFDNEELDEILKANGMGKIYEMGSETEIIIVGREEWDEEMLNEQIRLRAGDTIKFYSQEMFLAYIITGKDPYDDEEVLNAFAENHPAFNYLKAPSFNDEDNFIFTWPEIKVVPGRNKLKSDWTDKGLLKHMGYKVGAKGKSSLQRQEVLTDIYTRPELPNVVNEEYMLKWQSEPKSSERLKQIAITIASFCKNDMNNDAIKYATAISHYKEDLDWLKSTYYAPRRYSFKWPSTYVRII